MDFSQLTAYLDSLPKCGIPGCEMHVAYKGEEVYSHVAGVSRVDGRPADFSDVYRIFSCTKLFTATCVMRLVEEGRLATDDPVSKYLPEFATLTVKEEGELRPATEVMTVGHLLTMTGGLSYNMNHPEIQRVVASNGTTRQIVAAIAEVPLQFQPGKGYEYSLCIDVLGAIIEVVTGMKLGQYMRSVIFDPLGMTSATLCEKDVPAELIPHIYRYDCGLFKANLITDFNSGIQFSPNAESGGGGGLCTGSDYIKFAATLANGGTTPEGYRLISPESIDIMRRDRLNEQQRSKFIRTVGKPGYSYGYGVRTLISKEIGQSLSPLGEFGWDGMGGCYTLVDVENNLAIYFAMQVVGCSYCYSNVHPMLRNLTYKSLEL